MQIRLCVLFTSALLFACADAPLSPDLVGVAVQSSAPADRTAFDAVYDCSSAPVDPGMVKVVNGVLIQRGTVFHCPLSGDFEGVAVVVQSLTLRNLGTPQVEGRAFGTVELLVDKFFGRTDLEGTFKGPFNGSLEDLVFGELKVLRHGTGDYDGLVMHGVLFQDPPGSAILMEKGEIFGNAVP